MPKRSASPTPEPPAVEYTYTCAVCGRTHTIRRSYSAGSLPRYCPAAPGEKTSACQRAAKAEAVKLWRLRHPDQYKAANQRTIAQRKARKAAESDGENEA